MDLRRMLGLLIGLVAVGVAAIAATIMSNSATVTVEVRPAADAPVLEFAGPVAATDEDTAVRITWAMLMDAATITWADGPVDPARVKFRLESVVCGTMTVGGSPIIEGQTTLSAGDAVDWTPPADANGQMQMAKISVVITTSE